jgi:hypothetical protein
MIHALETRPKSTHNSQPARPVSEVLGAEFCNELQANAKIFDGAQETADNSKWVTAKLVNDMWDESKKYFEDKKQYYAECSRVANLGLSKKRFSDSGETLRRWCEVQAFYGGFSWGDKALDVYTFAHLIEAKRLAGRELVKSPLIALKAAFDNGWTSDELREHYDPAQKPHPYDTVKGHLATLMSKDSYPFLKDPAKLKECMAHASAIDAIIRSEIEREGKSAA